MGPSRFLEGCESDRNFSASSQHGFPWRSHTGGWRRGLGRLLAQAGTRGGAIALGRGRAALPGARRPGAGQGAAATLFAWLLAQSPGFAVFCRRWPSRVAGRWLTV
eukprot:scaffold12808_cov133-Isochrysis_galbana.AAC.2